jgi:translation initiation factor IF-3
MINSPQVRLVDSAGEQLGVMSSADALSRAEDAGLDLVEVSPNAKPPVCRIMDHGKFKYLLSKKAHEAKKKQTVIHVKEVKFRVKTEEHDLQYKLRNAKKFLLQGNKVKIGIFFRGREITHKELGMALLKRIEAEVIEEGTVEQMPKMEGRSMMMIIAPNQPKESRAKAEKVKADHAKADKAKADKVKADKVKAKPAAGEAKPGEAKVGEAKADEAKADEAKADEAKADEAKAKSATGEAKAGEAKASEAKTSEAKTSEATGSTKPIEQ